MSRVCLSVRARKDRLIRAGLSEAKVRTLKAVAKAVEQGLIDLDALATHPADAAHGALIELHGIGPWTADIYLLFCLGNADAWPAGDLAVQEAVRIALNLKKRPDAKAMIKLAERWRPWRGVAAHLFWAYYHVVKRREGAPVQASVPMPVKPAWPPVIKAKRPPKKLNEKLNGAARQR